MRYRYPERRTHRNTDALILTIHSDSLPEMRLAWEGLLTSIAYCDGWEEIEVYLTPLTRRCESPESLEQLRQRERVLVYQEETDSRRFGVPRFTVYHKSEESESYSGAANPWRPEDTQAILGYHADEDAIATLLATLKDLEASRGVGADIFVTGDQTVLSYRDGLQDRIRTLVMTPAEAADYIDVYLKRRGVYAYMPRYTVEGVHAYYWDWLSDLLPHFPAAWRTVVYGRDSLAGGVEAMAHLQSFYTRVLAILEIKDKVADQYYRRSNNSIQWRIMRELNTFFPLVTGTFDSLAWLCRYLSQYGPDVDASDRRFRRSITLRRETGNKLVEHIGASNSALADFIRSTSSQGLLDVFYPSRDSIQHRHPLAGVQFVRGTGQIRVPVLSTDHEKQITLAIVDDDTYKAIRDADDPADYFTEWGLYEFGDTHLLEPYKFVRRALTVLIAFYDQFLELLNLPGFVDETPGLQKRLEEVAQQQGGQPKSFWFPFLLEPGAPPIHPSLPRAFTGTKRTSASSDDSLALHGDHALFAESLYIG